MKNLIFIVALITGLNNVLTAQNIVNSEYFFDTDPGKGNGIPYVINVPGDTVIQQFNISTVGLSPGQHMFCLRTKNNLGNWSHTFSKTLFVNNPILPVVQFQIYLAEYFFDNDPGVGNGIPLLFASQGDTVAQQFSISTSGLSEGPHHFSMRTKNLLGKWSHTTSRTFMINAPLIQEPIIAAEYFYDSDPGVGNGTPVTIPSGDSIDTSLLLTNPFLSGIHNFVLRTKDTGGQWSHQLSKQFNVCSIYGANSDFTNFNDRKTVYFNNISQYDTAFYWDFDDGSTTTLQRNPVHEYAIAGIYDVSLTSYNACATDVFTQSVVVNGIQSIFPSYSADTNFYIGHIRGLGFQPGCVIKINLGATTIVADTTIFISDTDLKVIFRFNYPPKGFYNVIADNPLGVLDTLYGAFEIQTLRQPSLGLSHFGPGRVRTGRNSTQQYSLTNNGNTTLYMIPVFIIYSDSAGFVLNLSSLPELDSNLPPAILPLIPPNQTYPIPDPWNPEFPPLKMVAGMIPFLGPGQEVKFDYSANSPVQGCRIVTVKAGSPMSSDFINPFTNSCNFLPASMKCIMDIAGLFPVAGCVTGAANFGCTVGDVVNDALWGTNKTQWYDIAANWGGMILECVAGSAPSLAMQIAIEGTQSIAGAVGTLADCNNALNNLNPPMLPSESTPICWDNSIDPNEKYGPKGITADNYVNKYDPISYSVTFENADTATAPAAEVIIIDTLDISKLDLSTFRFTQFGFGDTLIIAPDEIKTEWVVDIDLRAAESIWLRSVARLDTLEGIVNWTFSSYDTTTFDLVTSPLLGFLPPNVNSPEGEGYIGYKIKPLLTATQGDIITNRATIIFDNNSPLVTSNYINTIDTIKPMSTVLPLNPVQIDSSFRIHISGSDAHAGIKDYFIYASVNDSAFKLFASGCPYDSLFFEYEGSNKYEFFSQARDRAYNLEDTVHVPDAVTLVTVGLEEPGTGFTFSLSPNPATLSVNIFIGSDSPEDFTVTLYDMQGSKMREWQTETNVSKQLNLYGLSQGLYYIKAETRNSQVLVKKIIVLN